ncbi:MAG: protein kinase [Polyangiales bacterium]
MSERSPDEGTEGAFPRTFGRYTLLEAMPGGGMGEVALAVSGVSVRRLCVVKTVRSDHAGHLPTVTRFLDEGRLLAALTHPNIAQILEAGIEGSVPFVAMEYISGIDLDIVMRTARAINETLPVDFVLTVISHALDAIAYANTATSLEGHPLGIVHRDLGPPNIRLSWDGTVKVLDFGTALATGRATQTLHGVMFGRPEYASPEQCRGDDLDTRSDLYTLGLVTWEMLSGKDFATGDGTEHMIAVAHGRKTLEPLRGSRPDLPEGLERWLATMTAYEPDARFSDAATARRRLLDLAQSAGVRADRECVARDLLRLFPGHREEDAERVRELAAQAPTSVTPPRVSLRDATTEPMGVLADANLLRGTRYRTGALLGRGGMGEVWAAEHVDLGRTVAVKVLDPETSNDPRVVERFRMEARAIAALTHPNLVHIYDLGSTEDGRLFYAMERLRGVTLRERLDAASDGAARPSVEEYVRIGVGVAQGLAAAHAVGVVHRDIKPENIFLTDDGAVKLLDFGVAKTTNASIARGSSNLTVAGQVFGTPAYMSPEQAKGLAVDHRADLYALAAVLYECLSGSPLFPDATPVETMAQHIHAEPMPLSQRAPRGSVPAALDAVIMGSLSKEPAHRAQSAREFADALGRSLDASAVTPASPPTSSRWAIRVVAALGALAVVGGVTLGLWLQRRNLPVEPPARGSSHAPGPSLAPVVAPPVALALTDASAQADDVSAPPNDAPGDAPGDAPVAPNAASSAGSSPPTTPEVAAAQQDAPRENWYGRARRELAAGHHELAAEYAQEAIRRRQHQRRARLVYGQALLNLGRREDAIRQWNMVLAQDPSNQEARRLLRYADAQGGAR